jgi:hypothetical protein
LEIDPQGFIFIPIPLPPPLYGSPKKERVVRLTKDKKEKKKKWLKKPRKRRKKKKGW